MLNTDEIGKSIAIVGKKHIYISDKPSIEDGFCNMRAKNDDKFIQVPDKQTERSVLYITAPSGSGKSYYTRGYIEQYHKAFPKRDVFIFSSLDSDPTLDKLKYIKRIKIKEEQFLNADLTSADFKDSLCVFDDTDVISNKVILKKVNILLDNFLETGRHFAVSVVFTSHNANLGLATKKILNECHSITIFPRNMGNRALKYLLDQYMGFSKDQIKDIKNNNEGRWTTIIKTYPMVLMTEKSISLLGSKIE
jgi:hypothetical protein